MAHHRYLPIVFWLIPLSVIFMVLAVSPGRTLSAPHTEERAQAVTVYPTTLSYGDSIEIAVTGYMPEYWLPAGTVTLAGHQLPIPGYLGTPGEKPVSDSDGRLTFKTTPEVNFPIGTQQLVVEVEGSFLASATVEIRGASLSLSPASAVANQRVWVFGTGFTPAPTSRSQASVSVYQITGKGDSVLTLAGVALRSPHVEYPIDLRPNGSLYAPVDIPTTSVTSQAGSLEIRATDSEGRTGVTNLTIQGHAVAITPASGYPAETARVIGRGFRASNTSLNISNHVDLTYNYVVGRVGETYHLPVDLGRAQVDSEGGFSAEFTIPTGAKTPSSNSVTATPRFGDALTVAHKVPGPSVSVQPNAAFNNDPIDIMVKGLPPNYLLPAGSVTIGGITVEIPGYFGRSGSRPRTDETGATTFSSLVPTGVPTGPHSIQFKRPTGTHISVRMVVLSGKLEFMPSAVVPGETVLVSSADLSASDKGAPGLFGNHQIIGTSDSLMTLAGARVDLPYLSYPIDLGPEGHMFVPLRIPVETATLGGGRLQIKAVDSAGRVATGTLSLESPSIATSPTTGVRGSEVTISGKGFIARSSTHPDLYQVDITYHGRLVATATPDHRGSFKATITVDNDAPICKTNRVTAKVQHMSVSASTVHSVPQRQIAGTFTAGRVGPELLVTGSGFPGFVGVRLKVGHILLMPEPPVYSDQYGNFETSIRIPDGIPQGTTRVTVQVQDVSLGFNIQVIGR